MPAALNGMRRIAAAGGILLGAACTSPQGAPSNEATTTASPVSAEESISAAVTASVELGQASTSIAIGEGGVWVRTTSNQLVRLNPDTAEVVVTIDVEGGRYGNVAVGAGAVWVTGYDTKTLYRIDPATNEVAAEIEVGWNPEGLAVTRDAVWVSNHHDGSVSRVDPKTNRVVATIVVGPEGDSGPKNIEILDGQPWVVVINNEKVLRIDPEMNEIGFQYSFPSLDGMFASDKTVFAIMGMQVAPIDAKTETDGEWFAPPFLPSTFGLSAFWAVAGGDLLRLDATSLEALERWHVSQSPDAYAEVAVEDDDAWLLFVDTGDVLKVDVSDQ